MGMGLAGGNSAVFPIIYVRRPLWRRMGACKHNSPPPVHWSGWLRAWASGRWCVPLRPLVVVGGFQCSSGPSPITKKGGLTWQVLGGSEGASTCPDLSPGCHPCKVIQDDPSHGRLPHPGQGLCPSPTPNPTVATLLTVSSPSPVPSLTTMARLWSTQGAHATTALRGSLQSPKRRPPQVPMQGLMPLSPPVLCALHHVLLLLPPFPRPHTRCASTCT